MHSYETDRKVTVYIAVKLYPKFFFRSLEN